MMDMHPGSKGNWLIWLPNCSPLYLKSCGCQAKFPSNKKKEEHHFHIQEGEGGGSGELQVSETQLYVLEDHGAHPPGRYIKAHEG